MQLRVCLIDDQPLLRDALAIDLGHLGHEVMVAGGGFESLDVIERGHPDVVVTDWNMPGMSGADLIALLRARFPGLPIVVMSGGAMDGARLDESTVSRLGANSYLAKPFRPRQLSATIESLARRARAA